jgi:hypothetical protein
MPLYRENTTPLSAGDLPTRSKSVASGIGLSAALLILKLENLSKILQNHTVIQQRPICYDVRHLATELDMVDVLLTAAILLWRGFVNAFCFGHRLGTMLALR